MPVLPDFTDSAPPGADRDELTGRDIARQAEVYSNAIVAFAVFQALTYSYAFGTNALFNCLIKSEPYLGAGLTLMFVVVLMLIGGAMNFLSEVIQSVAGRFREPVRRMYRIKLVTAVVFSLLPMTLTLVYGVVLQQPAHSCRRLLLHQEKSDRGDRSLSWQCSSGCHPAGG